MLTLIVITLSAWALSPWQTTTQHFFLSSHARKTQQVLPDRQEALIILYVSRLTITLILISEQPTKPS